MEKQKINHPNLVGSTGTLVVVIQFGTIGFHLYRNLVYWRLDETGLNIYRGGVCGMGRGTMTGSKKYYFVYKSL